MRFRFCYGQDCPDWVLEQITAVSKQSAIRLKTLVGDIADNLIRTKVGEVFQPITENGSDAIVASRDRSDSKVSSHGEMAASIAWILTSATRSRVADAELANELGQLGLPKEHATAIASVYRIKFNEINSILSMFWLRLYPTIDKITWRFENPLLSSDNYHTADSTGLVVTLSMTLKDTRSQSSDVNVKRKKSGADLVVVSLTQARLAMFIDELKQALYISKAIMQPSNE